MDYCLHKICRLVPAGWKQSGSLWDTLMSCLAPEHFASLFPDLLWRTCLLSQQPFLVAPAMTGILHLSHCLAGDPSSLG